MPDPPWSWLAMPFDWFGVYSGSRGLSGAWKRRFKQLLSKPDHEEELPKSNECEEGQRAAIARDRETRAEDEARESS